MKVAAEGESMKLVSYLYNFSRHIRQFVVFIETNIIVFGLGQSAHSIA